MSRLLLIASPVRWAVAGLAIGFGLRVNDVSVWLLALGLGGYVAYLWRHGEVKSETEGRLFVAGPAFILGWMVGFITHGLLF